MKDIAFCDLLLCSLIEIHEHYVSQEPAASIFIIEDLAVGSSSTLLNFCQSTWTHIPEVCILCIFHHDNFKSNTKFVTPLSKSLSCLCYVLQPPREVTLELTDDSWPTKIERAQPMPTKQQPSRYMFLHRHLHIFCGF